MEHGGGGGRIFDAVVEGYYIIFVQLPAATTIGPSIISPFSETTICVAVNCEGEGKRLTTGEWR